MDRKPRMRDECYNCKHLTGFVLSPRCKKNQDPMKTGGGRCPKYAIIMSKKKGEKES